MHINYTATEGVKLLGSEDGAWLSDGIDNGLQTLISGGYKETRTEAGNYTKTAQTWTEVPDTGTISVTSDLITINKGTTGAYVYTPITTAISGVYSVSINVVSVATPVTIRVGDTTDIAGERVSDATSSLGLFTIVFTATQTTHYLKVEAISSPNNETCIVKNEVEIRTAEIITGTELHTNANAASDPNGNEANAITGFVATGNGVVTSVGSPVDTGSYAISCVADGATNTSGMYVAFEISPVLVDDNEYIITFSARHNGTGGLVFIGVGSTTGSLTDTEIITLSSTDTTYAKYTVTFTKNSTNKYFICRENNGSNNGGVLIDNMSIRLAVPDLSSVNMGLGVYGSIDKHVVNVNADTVSYSGFSASNYLKQPYNSELDFGTGDFHFVLWTKSTHAATGHYLMRTPGSGAFIDLYVLSTGILYYHTTGSPNISTATVINDNVWHHIVMQRVSGVGEVWIDGIRVVTSADTADLDNTTAPLFIGVDQSLANPVSGAEISVISVGAISLTESQIVTDYNKEKLLFQRDRMHTVIDSTYDLDISPESTSRSTEVKRQSNTSIGGSTETLFQRNDRMWDFTTGNIHSLDIKYIRNCLDSIANGQTFTFDAYGTTAAASDPKSSTYESNFYAENRSGTTQYFKVGAKVRES